MHKDLNIVKSFLLVILFVLIQLKTGNAQLSGYVHNERGESLAYTTVYIKGTNKGSFSNEDGFYELALQKGENTVVFKYVGYASKEVQVFYKGESIKQDIILQGDHVILNTVVITPDKEDPAYEIIRKAIKARHHFKNKPLDYKAKVYQKFQVEILDIPVKIMGVTIAQSEEDQREIEEMVDTANNVQFVSETISDLFKGPNGETKEVIISSRISGDQNSYSTLSSEFSKLDFYDNSILLGRKMHSPIASNALLFYNYKLLGTLMDEKGNLINKIEVIPKSKHDPVFSGQIFIVENRWNISAVNLMAGSANTKIMFLDSINIRQTFKSFERDQNWALASQFATFDINFLGFKAKGFHSKSILDYQLDQGLEESFFGKIVMEVEETSNKRDSLYWEKIRPIPLSVKEQKAYSRLDSLEVIASSRSYLDSIDRENNKFSWMDLINGYSYRNRFKQFNFNIASPILRTRFNPVQGFHSNVDLTFNQNRDDGRNFNIKTILEYGLADKSLNPVIEWKQILDKKKDLEYSIRGGKKFVQPGEQIIMSDFINSLTSLIQGKNYIQLYQLNFVDFQLYRHFMTGIDASINVGYDHRKVLKNHSDYMFEERRSYEPNLYEEEGQLLYQKKLDVGINLSFRPGTKYISLPGELRKVYSNAPELYLQYKLALGLNEDFAHFNFIKAGIKGNSSNGLLGYTLYHFEGGTFLSAKRVDVIDDQYFKGNERYYVKNFKFRDAYQLLPYYHRAGFKNYFFLKTDHFLNGIIMDKLPLIRKLQLEEVLNMNLLYLDGEKLYSEFGIGLNGIFRFANIRYSWAFYGNEYYDRRFTFSFNISL